MKRKGMRKSVYALIVLLLFQAASFSGFAVESTIPEGDGGAAVALNTNNNLSALTILGGSLVPAFSADQTEYVVVADWTGFPITATGTADYADSLVSIIGAAVPSQIGSNEIIIEPGPGELSYNIDVTAEDGSTKTYQLKVYNDPWSSIMPPYLVGDLSVTSGPLTPGFHPNQPYYAGVVGNEVNQIGIMVNSIDPNADLLLIESTSFPIGMNSGMPFFVFLSDGFNRFRIIANSMGAPTTSYFIIIFKEAAPVLPKSSNNDLGALTISEGTLSPAFDAETVEYTATVASVTTKITVTGTASDGSASVSVDGGTDSEEVALSTTSATTSIPVLVTAEDGSEQTYSLTVTKEEPIPLSDNNNLGRLSFDGGTLYPAFDKDIVEYVIVADVPTVSTDPNVINLPNPIKVGGKPEATSATVTIAGIDTGLFLIRNGEIVTSIDGTILISIDPGEAEFTFRFEVKAENGDVKSYKLTVTNEQPVPLELSDLSISQGTLSPEFDPAQLAYTAMVANDTNVITVAGTASVSTVSVDGGTDSEEIVLNATSATTILVVVSAENEADQTYTLTVSKAEPSPLSGNNYLSDLLISEGSLTPDFEVEKTNYAVTVARDVTSLAITGTLADEKASMTVNGESATSGAVTGPIELVNESTTILIVVEAEDTMVKTYRVVVTKEAKKQVGRMHPIVAERTFGGRTIARFDTARFGLITQSAEGGLIDYRAPIRSKAADVRLRIPYADLMPMMTAGARDLILIYRGQEIRTPMATFQGDWLAGMPAGTDSTFEFHLTGNEAGAATYSIDFFIVEQLDEMTRLVHRKTVQK